MDRRGVPKTVTRVRQQQLRQGSVSGSARADSPRTSWWYEASQVVIACATRTFARLQAVGTALGKWRRRALEGQGAETR